MSTTTRPITAEQLWEMPDGGARCELVGGELHRTSPAGSEHGFVAMQFSAPLYQHVRARGLGRVYAAETGFILARNPDTVRAPDVAFVSSTRLAGTTGVKGYWPGAPDLAVEVLSPGDVPAEVEEKVSAWLQAGTRLVVVLDPRRCCATAYRARREIVELTEHDTLNCSDVVLGFTIALSAVFEWPGAGA